MTLLTHTQNFDAVFFKKKFEIFFKIFFKISSSIRKKISQKQHHFWIQDGHITITNLKYCIKTYKQTSFTKISKNLQEKLKKSACDPTIKKRLRVKGDSVDTFVLKNGASPKVVFLLFRHSNIKPNPGCC